ncbi:MAG: beta-lactamase family protein [Clostridia bacterium]|nr:beta-lactamase family protein [Clostridia bacterium]
MEKNKLMQNLAREAYEKNSNTGTWLYAENGKIVSKGAVGFRDPENTLPITEDTIFQLASVTKQFTAAAVMLLVRNGGLGLEDEITKIFPELTEYKGVTIRHLLTHTGGVPDYFADPDWFLNILKKEKRIPGNDEILRFLCETGLKPSFAPGEEWEYSNTGYNLLALAVERLSDVPYEEFLRKNIFEPAGMTSTRCCHIRRDGAPFENFARGAVIEGDEVKYAEDSGDGPYVIAFDGLNGDDYVYTNIFDMFAWDRALREEKVLAKEEQAIMCAPVVLNSGETYSNGDGVGYGFGWGVKNDAEFGLTVSHSGGMPGVSTWYERFIDADRVLVLLGSREPEDERTFESLFEGMRAIAMDKEPEPIITIEDIAVKDPDRSSWESFCGRYEKLSDEYPLDEVFIKDGDLYCKIDDLKFRLYPIGDNEFGIKCDTVKIVFSENCVTVDGIDCKKL